MKDFWFELSPNDELCKAQLNILIPLIKKRTNNYHELLNFKHITEHKRVVGIDGEYWRNYKLDNAPQLTIEEAIEELQKKEDYEIGDWVKITKVLHFGHSGEGSFGRVVEICPNYFKIDDFYKSSYYTTKEFRHATKEEIEKYLVESKGKEFKIGVTFQSPGCEWKWRIESTPIFVYDPDRDELRLYANVIGGIDMRSKYGCETYSVIYSNNNWAEIIPEEFEINGYTMKVTEDLIKFGCAEFDRKPFTKVIKSIVKYNNSHNGNRNIKSITLSSDVQISQFDELLKRMEK